MGEQIRGRRRGGRQSSEGVYLLGVGQAVSDGVGNDLEKRVGAEVLEVVDIRLDLNAVHPIDLLSIFLAERELDVRLAELDLFEAARRIGMEKTGVGFGSKLPFHGRAAQLSRYEKGKSEMGAEVLLRISRRFGKSMEWVLTGEDG
jgi:transcriptional regulator with XRE-family HTH domain